MFWLRAMGGWVLLAALMVANGVAREAVLVRLLKRRGADVASAVSGVAIILCVTRVVLRPFAGKAEARPGLLACAWTAMTVEFELIIGHYVDHKSWSELLGNYAIWRGRLWPLVLLSLALSPFVWTRWVPRANESAVLEHR